MNVDGRLLILPMGLWGLNHIRPTRAGIVTTQVYPKLSARYDGIYLWRGQEIVQIAAGIIYQLEVSPDGCRIAYLWSKRGDTGPRRLRVIDVCKSLGLAADAQPFAW